MHLAAADSIMERQVDEDAEITKLKIGRVNVIHALLQTNVYAATDDKEKFLQMETLQI